MIISKIVQDGIYLKSSTRDIPFQYSENLYMQFIKAANYSDWQVVGSYKSPKSSDAVLLQMDENGVFKLGPDAFRENGTLKISFSLYKDNQKVKLSEIEYEVKRSFEEGQVLPSDENTWVTLVERVATDVAQKYMNDNFDAKVDDAIKDIEAKKELIDKDIADFDNDYSSAKEMINKALENTADNVKKSETALNEISGRAETSKKEIDSYVQGKEESLRGPIGNVYFTAFKVVNGRLKMYSNPAYNKVRFLKEGSRLKVRIEL